MSSKKKYGSNPVLSQIHIQDLDENARQKHFNAHLERL